MKYFTHCQIHKLLLAGLLLVSYQIVFSQGDQSKKFSKTYPVTSNTVFSIENKYGNIDVRDWNNNEIKIDAEIILHNLDESKAAKAFNDVEISFSALGDQINVSTHYDDEFFDLVGKNYSEGSKKFEVNYVVMMPPTIKTNLENKYGDVFISKLNSQSNILVKYGNLQINQLSAADKNAMAEIKLAYSKGSIENCQWLNIDLSYSKLNIQDSKGLVIISKYSKLSIDKGVSIESDSKYDTYNIGTVSEFNAIAQYSNFKFDEITKKIKIDTKYTDFRVNHVPPDFEYIRIDNSYGSIAIGIDPMSAYQLHCNAKYANIRYPDNSRVNRIQ